jgi:bifunctional non-homologous end joining protein LigD
MIDAAAQRGRSTRPRATRRRLAADTLKRLCAALDGGEDSARIDVDDHVVDVTHLSRIYWPAERRSGQQAVTKRDYLRYLISVAPALLAHVRDRPLTLFRWPEGVTGRRHLEKHWNMRLPDFVERVDVFSESKGRTDQYILCNNVATLLWLAHMGVLEFHAWHSRVVPGPDTGGATTDFASSLDALQHSLLEFPDYLLFDLDPFIYSDDEKSREPSFNAPAFARAVDVANRLRDILDSLGLVPLLKTSGKTGLHVIVPIRRTLRYADVRDIAGLIAGHLLRQDPRAITVEWNVSKRRGKVFIDTNMNARGKSISVPFSPRALPGAPVSMPLAWDELPNVDPMAIRLPAAATWLAKRGDAWRGWIDGKQDLARALTRSAAERH